MIWVMLLFGCASHRAEPPASPAEVSGVRLVPRSELAPALFTPGERPRLVNFWATWCGPCEAELPHLRSFASEHHDTVDVVMISLDIASLHGKVERAVQDAELAHITHLQLDDPDPVMALPDIVPDWPNAVPVTLVVSPDGEVTRRFDRAVSPADLAGLGAATPGWWNR